MRRIGKASLVWIVVLFMAVDPAAACRWRYWGYCCPSVCYDYCAPVVCCDGYLNPEAAVNAPAAEPRLAPQPAPEPMPAPAAPQLRRPVEPRIAPPPAEAAPPAPLPAETPVPELPAEAPPAPEMPEEAPAAPTEPAAPAEEPAMPEEPAAKPSEEVEDLFKDSDAEKKPEEKPAEKSEDVEDLFKETDKKTSGRPVGTQQANLDLNQELEQLFADPADQVPHAAQETASPGAMRDWTDNTGKYHVRAKLVRIGQGHVRLLKETGKYTTVPFNRLSAGDLAFVRRHAATFVVGNP